MLNQQLTLRTYGTDMFEILANRYHTFLFPLEGTTQDEVLSEASDLMYHISMNLANEFLELNWGNWAVVSRETASIFWLKDTKAQMYLAGFAVEANTDKRDIDHINKFLNKFIPGKFLNCGKTATWNRCED